MHPLVGFLCLRRSSRMSEGIRVIRIPSANQPEYRLACTRELGTVTWGTDKAAPRGAASLNSHTPLNSVAETTRVAFRLRSLELLALLNHDLSGAK